MTELANQGPGFMRNRSPDGGATGRRVRWLLTGAHSGTRRRKLRAAACHFSTGHDSCTSRRCYFHRQGNCILLLFILNTPALASFPKLAAKELKSARQNFRSGACEMLLLVGGLQGKLIVVLSIFSTSICTA